ncbi:hypothetical protein OCH239_09660 [Roseivivax halodurans JCM 10272]|uniref:ParB/Sulfiredoxin domain-containing protein n=1 Tax=Roseivivax halodurans JCM 10272 TaxID=1449350 RepID=X7ECE4_9RHOB|nr:hypothetical protein [Roseivivax halodurans]ETX13535.1 hypothetical protein OCH239_09660 [Roseivivax halodurans JCM 10272]
MSSADEIAQSDRREDAIAPSVEAARLSFDVEEITPQKASELLETAVNPVEDKKAIATYAQAMSNGAWILNGQPIILDEKGRVIDGIQRLNACIVAETPFQTIVARNVRADTLHTIDQHRRRSYQGVLESRGVRNAGKVVRTMSKLIRIENGSLGRENLPISWSRYDRVLAANPEIIEASELAEDTKGSRLHSTARPVLAFMALRAGRKKELVSFLREIGPDRTSGLDSPPGAFCMQVAVLESSGVPLHVDSALALAVLVFNDFVKGKKVTQHYVWKPDLGNTPINEKTGEPISRQALREHAPANLGLPLVEGYPGLRDGRFDTSSSTDEFGGQTDEEVRQGAQTDEGREQVRMVNVTPELARKWLGFNSGNRKIQKNHIEVIRRDILAGNWMLNAQPICFTDDPEHPQDNDTPRLLNGQHRLHAIIAADAPIEVPIATGIPEAAFATFDTHAKRTVRRMGSRVDDRVLAAAAKLQWKEDNGYPLTGNGNTPSSTELLQTLDEHPDLAAGFGRARRKGMTEIGSAGVMTYFIYRVTREHAGWGEEFLDGIEYGANLDVENPILKLRNTAKGRRGGLSRGETLTLLLEHWETYKAWRKKQEEKAKGDNPRLI